LPLQHYRIIKNIDPLKDRYLIHFTDTKDNRDEDGDLKVECVVREVTEHLKDYSNNLIGVFQVDDIYWELTRVPKRDYYLSPWVEGELVDTPQVPDEAIRNEDRGYFFLNIGRLHNTVVKFENADIESTVCTVIHTPTKSNFWHFSIRWTFNGVEIDRWTNSIKRLMKAHAKTFVIRNAVFDIDNNGDDLVPLFVKAG